MAGDTRDGGQPLIGKEHDLDAAPVRLFRELCQAILIAANVEDEDFTPRQTRKELIAGIEIVDPTAGGNPVELTKDGALSLLGRQVTLDRGNSIADRVRSGRMRRFRSDT